MSKGEGRSSRVYRVFHTNGCVMQMSAMQKLCDSLGLGVVLKDKQVEVIEELMKGNSVFAMLPTGYGKSLCFWLPPLLLAKVSTFLI